MPAAVPPGLFRPRLTQIKARIQGPVTNSCHHAGKGWVRFMARARPEFPREDATLFEVLPESDGRWVFVKASGKLTDADYKALVPQREGAIDKHASIRLVGDQRWEELSAKALDRVTRGEFRYFGLAGSHPARAWIEKA